MLLFCLNYLACKSNLLRRLLCRFIYGPVLFFGNILRNHLVNSSICDNTLPFFYMKRRI